MLAEPLFRPPFFEIGPKAYLSGADVIELARAADALAERHGVQVLFTAPLLELARVAAETNNLIVAAPHMDPDPQGRGITKVVAESVAAAGARAVMLNHAEHPVTYDVLRATVERAHEAGLATVVCASSIAEIEAVARLSPDVIVAEPTELIGSGTTSDLSYMETSTQAVRAIDPRILVLQAAGISGGEDVYRVISAGADATGSSSAIAKAPDRTAMVDAMLGAVRRAWDERPQPTPNPQEGTP